MVLCSVLLVFSVWHVDIPSHYAGHGVLFPSFVQTLTIGPFQVTLMVKSDTFRNGVSGEVSFFFFC